MSELLLLVRAEWMEIEPEAVVDTSLKERESEGERGKRGAQAEARGLKHTSPRESPGVYRSARSGVRVTGAVTEGRGLL